jgi:hypothetical protein
MDRAITPINSGDKGIKSRKLDWELKYERRVVDQVPIPGEKIIMRQLF